MKLRYILTALLILSIPALVMADNGTIVLVKGEPFSLSLGTEPGSVWIFSNNGLSGSYDNNITRSVGKLGVVDILGNKTNSLDLGMYTLVIQRFGKNGFKEASYKEKYDLLGQLNSTLVSPFKTVPDININGLQPYMVQKALKEMVAQGIDDYLEYQKLEVQYPYTYVKGFDQGDNDTIYIYGITNLNPGNIIKVVWDSERQVSEKDFVKNTHFATVTQGNNYTNLWNVKFTTDIQNLPSGIHWVEITAKNQTGRISFRVYEIDKPQIAPPLMKIRYLDGGVVVTPTPEIVEVRVPYEVTVIQTVVIPTPSYPNDAFGVVYNPYKQQNTDNYIVPLMFIGLALVILRGKLWK